MQECDFICLRLRDTSAYLERVSPIRQKLYRANTALGFTELTLNLTGLGIRAEDVLQLITAQITAISEEDAPSRSPPVVAIVSGFPESETAFQTGVPASEVPGAARGLYRMLLADSWENLNPPVRCLHRSRPITRATGVFQVRQGSSWLCRALGRLARLPTSADAVNVQLVVTSTGAGEEWRRLFGGKPMISLQSARPDGRLAERMSLLELHFRLKVVAGALHYEPTGSALCLGRLRVPLPLRLGPRVIASEQSVPGSDQIEVAVEVGLPLFGLLISYGGRLAVCEAPG